jgi:glycolate oxidase FAD binding subunit
MLTDQEAKDPALQRLMDQVRDAQSRRQPLEIVGTGSKRFYGQAPTGTRLDTRPLCGISSYEPSELVVTVRTGTPLLELEEALAEKGQGLAFEPPRFAAADGLGAGGGDRGGTVGGMVAAGLAGPSRASVGGVRDFVLGATMLNGRAELLSFGGQVMKNVAGYDVARVLAGSMGILGVICEVSLKVLPLLVAQRTLRFEMEEAAAIQHLQTLGGQPLPLNASAWWDGMLVLRLAGAQAAVDSATRQLGGEVIEPAMAASFWQGLRDQSDEFFTGAEQAIARGAHLWRLSVPAGTTPLLLGGEQLIEWGGAQRWLCSATPAPAIRETARLAGGHAVLYRSSDAALRAQVGAFAPLSAPLQRIHRELKKAFDPEAIFNPGRLMAGL